MCILASAMQSAELAPARYIASASSCARARFLPFLNCAARGGGGQQVGKAAQAPCERSWGTGCLGGAGR